MSRGKVFLADVEKEVILEMASVVVSASTNPLSTRIMQSSPSVTSFQRGNLKSESTVVSCDKGLPDTNSMIFKGMQDDEEQRQELQRIPSAFKIKCKKDKGNSTSSPVKIWRTINSIQPSDNSMKPLHTLSSSPDTTAQSPCNYQEKLLKERLNVQLNPGTEQKPLIHPKFLLSPTSTKDNENENLQSMNATKQSAPFCNVKSSNVTCVFPEVQPLISKQMCSKEENCKQLKDSISTNIITNEEMCKKHSKTKMKGYAHVKKHILSYETKETDTKGKDEMQKKIQDKAKIKSIKHKEECLRCQSKSSEALKEQMPGKSFHIQAYKAYKNRHRENSTVDKLENEPIPPRGQVFYDQNKIDSENISYQNSMHFLKPCEEAIAFYETSRNPKMTSSYPMASQDKKSRKKNYLMKELCKGHLINCSTNESLSNICSPTHSSLDIHDCKSKEMSSKENMLSLSSGVIFDSECYHQSRKNIPTNDLSNPTSKALSHDIVNMSKPYYFNVPASLPTSTTITQSSKNQSKRLSNGDMICASNVLKMSKEELFQYESNSPFLKDSKVNGELEKIIAKSDGSKACTFFNATKTNNSESQFTSESLMENNIMNATELSKNKEEPEDFCLKEEKDYFDYKYRLCYDDDNKFEVCLNSCATSSSRENIRDKGVILNGKPLYHPHKNDNIVNETKINSNVTLKEAKHDKFSFEVDKTLEIETKSSTQLNEWLSSIKSSSKPHNKPSKEPKARYSNIHITPSKCIISQKYDLNTSIKSLTSSVGHSVLGNRCKESVLHSTQCNNVKCSLHAEAAVQPLAIKTRYGSRNNTLETFSQSMSQPIFSVLPFEGYCVSSQHPIKSVGNTCEKSNEIQTTSQVDPSTVKSQDDAIARRALKQRMKSKEASRLSTCSIQSVNEIHILKLHNFGDVPCSVESESHTKHIKDGSLSHKTGDSGTLQVRYIPKQCGISRPNKVQTTAHAQIKKDYNCIHGNVSLSGLSLSEGSATNSPNILMRSSPSQMQHSGPGICQNGQPSYDQNGLSASALSGPDLLQVSVIQPGASRKMDPTDQPPTPPKKQSFLSRIAHSPLFLFYKDAKK